MRVLALGGSARGGKGVTGRLLGALARGLEQGGALVDTWQACEMKVAPCLACLACMLRTPGVCVQRDDMDRLYPALAAADLLVLATPVYTDNMSAQLKVVMDRCIPSMQPYLVQGPDGRTRHPLTWSMPRRWLLLATCGFPEPVTFEPLKATFRAQAANFHSQPLGELCVPGSIAMQMEPEALGPHLDLIRQAGRELAAGHELPLPLLLAINRPPFSLDRYSQIARRYHELCRKKLKD